MNQQLFYDTIKILFLCSKIYKPFQITICGNSMLPILHNNEPILVCRKDSYEIGDILVFIYKQNNLLVHRLLKFENDRFYCKGDNSFRLEDLSKEQIIGAVILENDPHRSKEFIQDSYKINRLFKKYKYDIELTKQDPEYKRYYQKYLEV